MGSKLLICSNNQFYKNFRDIKFSNFLIKDFSVHFIVNKIRFWDVNTKFFVVSKIFRHLDVNIQNRLKNIFMQVVNDNSIWLVVMRKNLLLKLLIISNMLLSFLK